MLVHKYKQDLYNLIELFLAFQTSLLSVSLDSKRGATFVFFPGSRALFTELASMEKCKCHFKT